MYHLYSDRSRCNLISVSLKSYGFSSSLLNLQEKPQRRFSTSKQQHWVWSLLMPPCICAEKQAWGAKSCFLTGWIDTTLHFNDVFYRVVTVAFASWSFTRIRFSSGSSNFKGRRRKRVVMPESRQSVRNLALINKVWQTAFDCLKLLSMFVHQLDRSSGGEWIYSCIVL